MAASNDELKLPLNGGGAAAVHLKQEDWGWWTVMRIVDLLASIGFWWFLLYCELTTNQWHGGMAGFVVLMVLWRLVIAKTSVHNDATSELPYSCGYVSSNGKELFLVATVHISPKAPRDVKAVIDLTKPDIAMIELDEERLDRMREPECVPTAPKDEDLQPIKITSSAEPPTYLAQRAFWNAEQSGETISGDVFFDEENTYGVIQRAKPTLNGKILIVRRGAPEGADVGLSATFKMKAHYAAKAGASALLIINNEDKLPVQRIGGGDVTGEVKIAIKSGNCGFPSIPLMLLKKSDGDALLDEFKTARSCCAELTVCEDDYPRRTVKKRLCQAFALVFSGIGILYGVIQCFAVEVGAEFTAAEVEAKAHGIPCACIDVDMNKFWGRLGAALLPTPCNLFKSLTSWLAFPRVLAQAFFPPRGNIDCVGSTILHAASFPIRTWVAFAIAGYCSSFVMNHILQLFASVGEHGAEASGAINPANEKDRKNNTQLVMLLIEMYIFPQVYDAVAASRDEAMYRSIVATALERNVKRVVAVVGAGHSNGILHYARTSGL